MAKDLSNIAPNKPLIKVTKENIKSVYREGTIFVIKSTNIINSFAFRPFVKPGEYYNWPWLWNGEVFVAKIKSQPHAEYLKWEQDFKDHIKKEIINERLYCIIWN